MNLRKTIVGQFKKPQGFLGSLAGWIMANRCSNRERNEWTVDLLDVQTGDMVLEIGCGPGLALEGCLARSGNGQIVGLDHSQTMLNQARLRNAAAHRDGRLKLQLGNVDDFSWTSGSFDKVYSVNVVQFFPDRAAAFRKMYSMLIPKGVVASTYLPRSKNPNRESALKMANEIQEHMEVAGFANIRTEELSLEPVPAICVIGEHP